MINRRHLCVACVIAVLIPLSANVPNVLAQQSETDITVNRFPIVYIHGGGGFALTRHASKDILNSIGEDWEMATGQASGSYSINTGISFIAQYEYRRSYSDHNLSNLDTDFSDGWTNPKFTTTKVEMGYDTWDTVVKLNLLTPLLLDPREWKSFRVHPPVCIFLLFGKGTVEYFDEFGDGYEGTSKIRGVEIAYIKKYYSYGINVKKYTIDYTDNYLDTGDTYKATDWHILFYFTVGLGI